MKPKIIMTKGLPASGKSTWARTQIKQGGHVKRVNKDDLRAMLDNSNHNKLNEEFVLDVRNFIVKTALSRGQTIIVDDTNFAPKHQVALETMAKEANAEFQVKDFTDVDVEECIKRDAAREKSVGEKVIRDMYEQWLAKPTRNSVPKCVQDESLPHVIICDLDGTIALLGDRSPYDAGSCFKDELNAPIANILKRMGLQVIFLSGREEKFRSETCDWLDLHGIANEQEPFYSRPNKLFMRPTGDSRNDAIVKKELYEKYIKDKHFVEFVLDDRNRVVDMWRSLGLTCLQVAPGDF